MNEIQATEARKHRARLRDKKSAAPVISSGLLENIYQALTGAGQMPSHLQKRALANGLPEAQLRDAVQSARTVAALPDYLLAASEHKFEKALYFDELGLKTRSRDLYLESTLWAIYAELFYEDPEKKELIYRKYRESYRRAAPHFNHPGQEVSIPYMASSLSGYLRKPGQAEDGEQRQLPVVVILNSIYSAREELHYLENSLLSQGFATLSFDYPGTHTHSLQVFSAFDVKELGNSIYLFLSSCDEIDVSRIALYGQSLGGRLAMYMMLAYPERFSCLVSMSCPLNVIRDIDKLAPVFAREYLVSNYTARTTLYELALHTQIEEDIRFIEAPLLVLGGGKDKFANADASRQIFDQSLSADKKLILCPGARHCLYEMMPSLRYEIAQWIKQRA